MGKIPEYQRDKFASTYVGAPQLDTSGVQTVEGINKAVAPITDIAATEMHNREVMRIDQQANNALVHYGLAYQQQLKALETEYAANPDGYPAAAAELGQTLQNEYAQNIPDARIRTRFSKAAGSVVLQSSSAALKWAEVQKEENALTAARDTMRVSALKTGNTYSVEALQANMATTEAEIQTMTNIPPAERQKFLEKSMPDAIESHLYNRINASDPQAVIDDLEREDSPYNKMKYYSADLKQKAISAARTRINQNKTLMNQAKEDNYANDLDALAEGTLTFEAIDARAMAPNESEQLKPRDLVRLKDSLVNKIQSDAAKLEKSTESAKTYTDLAYSVFDNKVDRARVLDGIVDAYRDGILTKEETKFLNQSRRLMQDAKTAKRSMSIAKGFETVRNNAEKMWVGDEKLVPEALAIRDLISGVQKTEDIEKVQKQVIGDMMKKKLTEKGVSFDNIPTGGKRIGDGKGGYIWVYPDGTYKEE